MTSTEHNVDNVLRSQLMAHAALLQTGDQVDLAQEIRWFVTLVACCGWPGRRLVGADGAHAAFRLAACCPAPYRQGWLPKIRSAVVRRDVPRQKLEQFEARLNADCHDEPVR